MVSNRFSRGMASGVLGFAAALAGCAALAPASAPLGTPIGAVRSGSFGPTGEYPLPGGGTRLEFAQGSFGRQTWMMDFDAKGVLTSKEQVLELTANEERSFRKSHSMRLITTRVYHAGHHAVDLRINGQVVASAGFDLRV